MYSHPFDNATKYDWRQYASSYPLLVKALEEIFPSLRIQAVQSSSFDERKQSSTKTVVNYAQDLRKECSQGSKEAEVTRRSVLDINSQLDFSDIKG